MDLNSEECPRFRILIVGRTGTGKSTLIRAVFGASLADVQRDRANAADINEGITSPHNKHLILHGFQQYDPESVEKSDILKKFIKEQGQKESLSERLHAIWLCIAVPRDDGEMLKVVNESIFKLNRNKVPIIVVFTKFDLFIDSLNKAGTDVQNLAEEKFKERYSRIFENATKSDLDHTQYTLVSISLRETLCRLVNFTMQSVGNNISSPRTGIAGLKSHVFNSFKTGGKTLRTRSHDDSWDLAQILLAAAQGVNIPIKITASIKAVKEKYWRAIGPDVSLQKCISKIHRGIVTTWDMRNLNEFLLSDEFYHQVIVVVDDLNHSNTTTTHRDVTKASRAAGEWTKDVYQGRPEHIRCLMGCVVDIISILQDVFQISLEDRRKLTPDDVHGVIYDFICSERKELIHKAITAFVGDQALPESDKIMDRIESLIKETETKKTDTQFAQTRLLPSLLAILKFETSPQNATNRFTLDLMGKLLDSPDHLAAASALGDDSDVELLLGFILYLLRNGCLENSYTQDANRKARRLVDKLSKKDVLPKTLFIDDVKTDLSSISVGGFGSVFKGEHHGRPVALKVLYKARDREDSLRKDFCREALAWWSLSHQFILPLLGIYKENSRLFLISPYMTNGTLVQWRKKQWPGEIYIRSMMLEVARGLQYIHSEGIVHGDLSAANVLLDSEFHCHITDFGLTRQFESTIAQSTTAISINYAAPELLGKGKTMQTDVYAYGCVYYAVFFDTIPFQEEQPFRIPMLHLNGKQPSRLSNPKMDDDTWNLVEKCWFRDPFKRPTMEQIVDSNTPSPDSPLTALMIELRGHGDSMVNQYTLRLARQLLDLSEFDSVISQLTTVSDVELLLDFILHLLRNHALVDLGSRDANRKARRLMFKLLSTTTVIPKTLFIADVKAEQHLGAVGIGGFGRVFRGEYKGQQVSLKTVERARHNNDSILGSLQKEAFVWRSLSHRFILPLLGVFEENSALFLVTPYMENGMIHPWRRKQGPDVANIHRLMLEVAEGVRYLHSEGIVHGDLNSRSILLDSKLHVQITDFGSTRHSESSVAQSTTTFLPSYAAPELFGMCVKCGLMECDGCDVGHRSKTMETDVYAFGCLYYETFFDTIPFHGKNAFQVVRLVMSGVRPNRLEHPRMEDNTWTLIEDCWKAHPSERPTMEQIVTTLTSFWESKS